MLITCLPDRYAINDYLVISAQVTWEDCNQKNRVIYACVPASAARAAARGEWLLLCTAFTAARHGERRVKLDLPVDPLLRRGLGHAMHQLQVWYGASETCIEAVSVGSKSLERGTREAALFVTGGVDSWSSLVRNRAEVAVSHPLSFKTGLQVDWMGPSDASEIDDYLRLMKTRRQTTTSALEAYGLDLVTPVTNVRRLDGNVFHLDWMFSDHGAMLSAFAHLLTGRLWSASIASTYDLDELGPWGSHPLLDPWFGSTELRVLHDSPDLSRMQKLRSLASRPEVLNSLDVCVYWFQRLDQAVPNCGCCEKCLRTLFGLESGGASTAGLANFEQCDLAEALDKLGHFQDEYERRCWSDILAGLESRAHPLRHPVRKLLDRADLSNPYRRG